MAESLRRQSGPPVDADREDIELPILEHTTALSDGYASPAVMLSPVISREASDDEEARAEGRPMVPRAAGEDAGQAGDAGPSSDSKSDRPEHGRGCRGSCGRFGGIVISNLYRVLLLGIIVTLIVLVSVNGVSIFGDILGWFEKQNGWWPGWVCFLLMFIVNVSLFLPGVALILGAGFVFGFWKGLLAVWVGGAIGQAGAFLLARYLVRDWVVEYVAHKWSKWDLVDDMIEAEGWVLVVLLRLSPIVPWNLLNVVMATTRMHFLSFTVASAIGIGFESSVLTYFGSLAQDIHHIVGGEANPHGPVVYVLTGTSLVFCAVAAIVATVFVKRALRRADAQRKLAALRPALEAGDDDVAEAGYGPLYSPQPRSPAWAHGEAAKVANRSAADEFAQRASVRLGSGDGRHHGGEEDEGQQLITSAVSSHDAGFGQTSSHMGFNVMRDDPETGLGPDNLAAAHDTAGLHSSGSGGAAGLGTSLQDRLSWGHHRRTGSAAGIEMRASPQVSDGSTGPASRDGSGHGGGSAASRLGPSPLGGSPRSDEDGL